MSAERLTVPSWPQIDRRVTTQRTADEAMAARVAELDALERTITAGAPLPPDPRVTGLEARIAALVATLQATERHLQHERATLANLQIVVADAITKAFAP